MSYNTRRSGGQGVGESRDMYSQQQRSSSRLQTSMPNMQSQQGYTSKPPVSGSYGGVGRGSQVLYHQQQSRPSSQSRMPTSMSNSQHSGYNSSLSSSYSGSQSYTTSTPQQQSQQRAQSPQQSPQQQQHQAQSQPPPPPPPQQQQSYSTQQYQAQQQQQQQSPPPPPPPQAPKSVTPQQMPSQNIKAEPVTPKGQAMEMEVESSSNPETPAGEVTKARSWQFKKKMPGFKINKKVKKRRQNARLRKILQPKNAIMVLNELKTGIKFTFQEHTNALTQTMFVVNAEVDGKIHTGQGLSKPLAKQNAAENALKALLLEKMAQATMKDHQEGSEPMQEDTNNGTAAPTGNANTSGGESGGEEGSESGKPEAPEDDVPWGSLASFALYKLFTEWQSQGTHVPIPKQSVAPPSQVARSTSAPAPMKKIPDNPTDRHPVMLLNQLRPGIQFTELCREGTPPNLTFTLGVTVDGKSYTGVAKNKKDAKKEAAKAALAGALNIVYN